MTPVFLSPLCRAGRCAEPDKREMTHGTWVTPLHALKANQTGAMPLSPPTLVTLQQLLAFEHLDVVMQAAEKRSWGPALEPRLIPTDAGPVIVEPWDPQYTDPDLLIDVTALSSGKVTAGASFSRLWLNGGIWCPVAMVA